MQPVGALAAAEQFGPVQPPTEGAEQLPPAQLPEAGAEQLPPAQLPVAGAEQLPPEQEPDMQLPPWHPLDELPKSARRRRKSSACAGRLTNTASKRAMEIRIEIPSLAQFARKEPN